MITQYHRFISERKKEHLYESIDYTKYNLNQWDSVERDMFLRFYDVAKAKKITHYEAAMLIASDKKLFTDIADYKYQNTPIPVESQQKLINIVRKVIPVDDVFYRGVEHEDYDEKHIMSFQSWTPSIDVASWFGNYIYQTTKPCKGVNLSDIYYWHGLINGESDGFGDAQAEWFLFEPKTELM